MTNEECLPADLLLGTYEQCLMGLAVLVSVHIMCCTFHITYLKLNERKLCVILQEHFHFYVILQFVRHTSVTEVICKVKV
jgi:hypothetical protein